MIQVNHQRDGFIDAATGQPFVPVGTNYCNLLSMVNYQGRLCRFGQLFGTDHQTLADPLAEATDWMKRLADLGMNVIRIWTEPCEFFPTGAALDPRTADRFEALLDCCAANGIYASVGMHLSPLASGWRLHNFQPPHQRWLLEQLQTFARRWGVHEHIFSWTIVGEGQLPWYTRWLGEQWPHWLQFWYNDDLAALKRAWGKLPGVDFNTFADAPVPPRNLWASLGFVDYPPARLAELPTDPYAGSTWRYDWRVFLENTGAARVQQEVQTLRTAGARQMIAVGANCWSFPNLPVGQMTMGYVPNFFLDSVDYLCQHNYPMPQCLPGGLGDPLASDAAMDQWLIANQIMGRLYTSLRKPVVLEEWGWYGGGSSDFAGVKLVHRTDEEQERYCDLFLQSSRSVFSGFFHWLHRDMPHDGDLTRFGGMFRADRTLKPWGRKYGQRAAELRANPPRPAPAKTIIDLPIVSMFTDDRAHENWWLEQIRDYPGHGPCDYRYEFPRKPMVDYPSDIRGLEIVDYAQDAWAQ